MDFIPGMVQTQWSAFCPPEDFLLSRTEYRTNDFSEH